MNEIKQIEGTPVEKLKSTLWSRMFPKSIHEEATHNKKNVVNILVSPEFFESYYGLDYKTMPQEVGAILSQGEHEFLRSKFPEKLGTELTSEELSVHQLEWARVVKNVSKGKLTSKEVDLLQGLTPHMLANFAEIEGENVNNFSGLIRLGGWSKKALEKQQDLAA